jgi:hypothetical protein
LGATWSRSPDHLDLKRGRARLGLRLEDRPDGGDGDEHQDERRDQRPGDLEGCVTVDLSGFGVPRAGAKAPDDVEQECCDEHPDSDTEVEQAIGQGIDGAPKLRARIERGVWNLRRTANQTQSQHGRQRGGHEPARAVTISHPRS